MTLTNLQHGRLVAFFSDITCGESCWQAREDVCRCSCGGKNHGINLRGEDAVRTAKIGGCRYELVAVGTHSELIDEGARLTAEAWLAQGRTNDSSGQPYARTDLFWFHEGAEKPKGWIEWHHLKGSGDLYCVKYASLPQCLKWQELAYFDIGTESDRYRSNAAILWRRADLEK